MAEFVIITTDNNTEVIVNLDHVTSVWQYRSESNPSLVQYHFVLVGDTEVRTKFIDPTKLMPLLGVQGQARRLP